MNSNTMDDDLLILMASYGLVVSDLELLSNTNPYNPTVLYKAKLLTDNKLQAIFIKQLKYPYLAINYQQFCHEITALSACHALAIKESTLKKSLYGIPQLIFHSKDKLSPFFILPFYQGQTLKSLIIKDRLNIEQKLNIAISVCHLLTKIHKLGYLHCDIKSSNLLITPTSQVILLDFGLSQLIGSHTEAETTTSGTPAYMSPEQFNGLELTPQSDYYSLGVVLFELFTGHLPFSADNIQAWALAHCQQSPPNILENFIVKERLANNQIQILQSMFNQLLAKFSNERPKNLEETIKMLSYLALDI